MDKNNFPYIFWGFVSFVIISFIGIYFLVLKPINDPNSKMLWSALVFLVILTGIIAITAFINRNS